MSAPARTPWHDLGHDVAGAQTALDAMTLGGLHGWGVRKTALHADGLAVPGRFAVVAGSPFGGTPHEVLAIVGGEARVEQNEDYAPLLDALVEETGATFAAAGTMGSAARAFVALHLPGYVTIDGDRVDLYLALVIDRDGFAKRAGGTTLLVHGVHAGTGAVLPVYDGALRVQASDARGGQRAVVDSVFRLVEGQVERWRYTGRRIYAESYLPHPLMRMHGVLSHVPGTRARAAAENAVEETLSVFSTLPRTLWGAYVAACAWHDTRFPVRADDRTTARRVRALLDPTWKQSAWATL